MKKIIAMDWALLLAFTLSVFSGIGLHIAWHIAKHTVWYGWTLFHLMPAVLFLLLGILHIKAHWNWYRGLVKRNFGKKSKTTLILSILFLLLSVTGVTLLFVGDSGYIIRQVHYRTGMLMVAFSLVHILKRIRILFSSI